MNGRFGCISTIDELRFNFKVEFKFPHLYKRQPILDCNTESTHVVLTSQDQKILQPAIWGLLPNNYDRNWDVFQSMVKSVYVYEHDLNEEVWWSDAMSSRRCLIPVTSFFTTHVLNGDTSIYQLGYENNQPFYLAGIYNLTIDGFLTFAIFMKNAPNSLNTFQNIHNQIPLIVEDEFATSWLNGTHLGIGICQDESMVGKLVATSIPTDLFVNDITYDSLLSPEKDKCTTSSKTKSFFYQQ